MENKKKQAAYVVLILLCFGGMGWIWLPGVFEDKSAQGDAQQLMSIFGSEEGAPSAPAASGGSKGLNYKILQSPRFQELVEPQELSIDPSELGRENPFLNVVPSSLPTSTPPVANNP